MHICGALLRSRARTPLLSTWPRGWRGRHPGTPANGEHCALHRPRGLRQDAELRAAEGRLGTLGLQICDPGPHAHPTMSLAGVKRAPARQSSGKLATAASPARLPAALLLSRRRSALFGRSNTCAARAATFIRAIERGAAQTPRPMRSYYDVLGVPTTATPQELRAAFTAAALRLHPDKAAQQPAADRSAAEFLEAQRAYQVRSEGPWAPGSTTRRGRLRQRLGAGSACAGAAGPSPQEDP